ncbi:MAG TPA: hypothetical protein DDW52_17730 [Planctomycetaceae bacterium]|nr:hypothetical protein [Planctomycetaceae bacterium]
MDTNQFSEAVSLLGDALQQIARSAPKMLEDSVGRAIDRSGIRTNSPSPSSPTTAGTVLTGSDKAKATELRDAYLLGKLPEDGGLLVGTKQVSALLNISSRTISRLIQEKAMPNPIKLGNRTQWRLREIIEWVEADCPPQRHWNYSEGRGTDTRKKK